MSEPLSATGLVTSGDSVSQLAIGWNAPLDSDYTSFTVKLAEVSSSERSVTYDTRTATFDQLLAGGRFTAVVTTVSGDQVAEDLTAIFYTSTFYTVIVPEAVITGQLRLSSTM